MDLIIDCENGVSGDMLVGALLDLGADQSVLLSAIESLNVSGFVVEIEKVFKESVPATDFNVVMQENYDADMEYLYGEKQIEMDIETKRNLPAIKNIIENSSLTPHAKNLAYKIFEVVAVCEAKAHGIAVNDVIFHENGAIDSIVDITSFAVCLDNLQIENVYFKNLREGSGKIKARCGVLPIPTPAVKNICRAFKLNPAPANVEYELITPTGLACLAVVGKQITDGEFKYKSYKTGYGAGKRDYTLPALLKAELVESL